MSTSVTPERRIGEPDQDPTPTRQWGYMANGEFRVLPKPPLLLGGFGPPPFSVKLPSGEMRDVVADPNWTPSEEDLNERQPAG